MSVRMRQFVEQLIVNALVDAALAAGYSISVSLERGYDVDDMIENKVLGTRDKAKIMEQAFAGDECHLFIHKPDAKCILTVDRTLISVGWIYVILGNGQDCISDYIDKPEIAKLVDAAKPICDYFDGDGPFEMLPERVLAPKLYHALRKAESVIRGIAPFMETCRDIHAEMVADIQADLKAAEDTPVSARS